MLAHGYGQTREIVGSGGTYETVTRQVPYGHRKEYLVYDIALSLQIMLQAFCVKFVFGYDRLAVGKTAVTVKSMLTRGMSSAWVRCTISLRSVHKYMQKQGNCTARVQDICNAL